MDAEQALNAARDRITPLAVVDERCLGENIARMARLASGAGIALRPHAKTHKSPTVGLRQVRGGAIGLTVATLHEAEVFLDAGIDDLLLAHPPVGEVKLARLAALADRARRVAVALDDVQVAARLPASVEVLWEVDTGQHRIGTGAGEATAAAVQRLVARIGVERFRGLATHGGHAYGARNDSDRRQAAADERDGLTSSARMIRELGIPVGTISVGSTPTASFSPLLEGITEMRPGTYVYGDANQVALGSQALEQCALGVVATVVSTPDPDRAVLDAGSKALSGDLRVAGLDGYGVVIGRPDLRLDRLSEEHGMLSAGGSTRLAIGDRVVVIPAHACTTVNLHPRVLMFAGDGSSRWDPVLGRGWEATGTSPSGTPPG
ncbi:MAG: alanine racemase [Candidatus Dormibacteraceae bacterium]